MIRCPLGEEPPSFPHQEGLLFGKMRIMPTERFKFLNDIVLADVAFEAYGDTLEELFESTAAAFLDVSVDPKTLKNPKVQRHFTLQTENLEDLLYDFLSELIFLKDTRGFLAGKLTLIIQQAQNKYSLEAKLKGEIIDPKKHELKVDVKAVTKHLFEIKKVKRGYTATVVLDI